MLLKLIGVFVFAGVMAVITTSLKRHFKDYTQRAKNNAKK